MFARVLKQQGAFDNDEFDLYSRAYDLVAKSVPKLHTVIWLRCQPEVSLERIKSRNRDFEKGIEIGYLDALDQEYARWFNSLTGVQKTKIDTSAQTTEIVAQEIFDFLQ